VDPKRKQKQMKFSMGYMLIALLVVWLFNDLIFRPLFISETEVTYSDFLRDLEAGKVEHVSIGGDRILFNLRNESTGKTGLRNAVRVDDPQIVERLLEAKVPFEAQSQTKGVVEALLGWVLPFLPLLVIWYFFYKRMSEGGAGVMSIGKSKAQEIH